MAIQATAFSFLEDLPLGFELPEEALAALGLEQTKDDGPGMSGDRNMLPGPGRLSLLELGRDTEMPIARSGPVDVVRPGADPSYDRAHLYDVLGKLGVDEEWIQAKCDKYQVPQDVVERIIWQGSVKPALDKTRSRDLAAIAKTALGLGTNDGPRGLMQLTPAIARTLGVKSRTDAKQNLLGGIKHLRQQLEAFDGDLVRALAAYHTGADKVRKHKGLPQETPDYVLNILGTDERLAA